MAMGIFEQLDWLTKKVKALCCIVENGGGGGSALTIKDEGTTLTTAATSIDFTGDGVTGTNTGSAVTINIPGTVYTDGVTIGGDGASGNALKTLMPVVSNISLASANYDATTEGVYEVTTGTGSLAPFYFNFPDASVTANQGKRFIIVNKDATGLNVETTTFNIRGTSLTSSIVPPGESYEFVSVLLGGITWTWVCINCPLYKSYVALISQNGPNPPVETVLENTIGPLTWGYSATGVYTLNSTASPFTTGKTTVSIGPSDNSSSSGPFLTEYSTSSGTSILEFLSYDLTATLADGYFTNSLIEVRVYY